MSSPFPRLPMLALGLVAGGLLGASCKDEARPWRGPVPSAVDAPSAFLPGDAQPSLLAGAFGGAGGQGGRPEATAVAAPIDGGGLWRTCAMGFLATGPPLADVTRLGLACGPINGMKRHLGPRRGELRPSRPERVEVPLEAGTCLRVMATADEAVGDLDTRIRDAQGVVLAEDGTSARWAIVDPARPLCTRDATTFTIELSSAQRGRYALEVWTLTR